MTRPKGAARMVAALGLPFRRFFALEASSSVLLLLATIAALAWANSRWAGAYEHFLHLPLAIQAGAFRFEMSLAHFVKDALMAVFFFVVGLEIKRELVQGELSTRARAMLPVAGALGGMLAPAAIYASLHAGGPAIRGWGIPMATDIAFAVAALSVFGPRVPAPLKIFLLALAIADDIGAVAVIAIFYTEHVAVDWLAAAGAALALVVVLQRAGVAVYGVYLGAGAFVWYATLQSGIHATVAGVALGLLTPMRRFGGASASPLEVLEHRLHGWVAFVVMPLFALCNAGVAVDAATLADATAVRVAIAVALGLVAGKPLGIVLVAWLAVRSGLAAMPREITWPQVAGAGLLAGIGFTVALFIASLAFEGSTFEAGAKLGTLCASAVAAGLGMAVLSRALPRRALAAGAAGQHGRSAAH